MKNIICYTLLSAAFLGSHAHPGSAAEVEKTPTASASSKQPPGTGPLIQKRAPEMSQWTVTFSGMATARQQSKEDKGQTAPAPNPAQASDTKDRLTTVTKTKNIYHIKLVDSANFTVEKWYLEGVEISIHKNAQAPVISNAENPDAYHMNLRQEDFKGFEWISMSNFVEVRNVLGTDCLIFQGKVSPYPGRTEDAEAAVDVKTRLPVHLRVGEEISTYKFSTAPASMLTPPANISSVVSRWNKRQQQAKLQSPP